jgi:hypothetical protein
MTKPKPPFQRTIPVGGLLPIDSQMPFHLWGFHPPQIFFTFMPSQNWNPWGAPSLENFFQKGRSGSIILIGKLFSGEKI